MLILSTSGITRYKLTKVNFDFLCARFVRDDDLTWHIRSFFIFIFLFLSNHVYSFLAALSLADLARGLITNSTFSAVTGFFKIISSSDSSPRLDADLK